MSDSDSSKSATDDLVFRAMEPTDADLRLFHDCFATNGSPRSMEMLRWQYLQPPAGSLLVNFAVTSAPEQRLAAIYAVFAVYMRAAGKRVLAVQSLNTLTDAAFRGRGLFVRMAHSLYARSAELGAQVVYGFPNGNSAHGIFRRLEWQSLDPLPVLIKPLRAGYALRKLGLTRLAQLLDVPLSFTRSPALSPGLKFHTVTEVASEFDSVWKSFAEPVDYAVERDSAYLAWRLQRPGEQYECIVLRDNDAAVGLAIIGTTVGADGHRVGKLMDHFYLPRYARAGELLVAEAVYRLRQKGCGVVWAWNFNHSSNHPSLKRAGFFSLPANRRGAEGHVGARAFTGLPAIGDRTKWYVSLLDSDTD